MKTKKQWLNYIAEDKTYPKRAIILDIYDDFDSRICETCAQLLGKDKTTKCSLGYLPDNLYAFEYGCNKFKRKVI